MVGTEGFTEVVSWLASWWPVMVEPDYAPLVSALTHHEGQPQEDPVLANRKSY